MIARSFIPILLLAAELTAQQVPQGGARFGIIGTVIDAESDTPIPQALVTVFEEENDGGRQQFAILTDLAGGFQIRNMPVGNYRLQASKSGYSRSQQRNYSSSISRTLHAPDDPSRTEMVKLYLSRQSVLEGTVLDSQGRPIPGTIQTFQLVVRGGRHRVVRSNNSTPVDAVGAFRIAGLSPGKYYVGFSPSHFGVPGAPHYAPVLYPGVSTVQGARLFEVVPGREEQIHFRPSPQPAYEVQGAMPAMNNRFLWVQSLETRGVPFDESYPTRYNTRDGTLSISGLFPGNYAVHVSDSPSSMHYIFHVGAQDTTNAAFTPMPKPAIQGTIRIEEPLSQTGLGEQTQRPQPPNINFYSIDRQAQAQVAADNVTFTVDNILPGTYELLVSTTPPQYVKSARQNGRDLLRDDLVVTAGGADTIEIEIGQRPARVTYLVANPAEGPAAVSWIALRYFGRSYRMEALGTLRTPVPGAPPEGVNRGFNGLAPGDYLFFAWDGEYGQAGQLAYNEEEFLKKYASLGQRLTLYEAQNLELILEPRLPAEAFEAR